MTSRSTAVSRARARAHFPNSDRIYHPPADRAAAENTGAVHGGASAAATVHRGSESAARQRKKENSGCLPEFAGRNRKMPGLLPSHRTHRTTAWPPPIFPTEIVGGAASVEQQRARWASGSSTKYTAHSAQRTAHSAQRNTKRTARGTGLRPCLWRRCDTDSEAEAETRPGEKNKRTSVTRTDQSVAVLGGLAQGVGGGRLSEGSAALCT